MSISVIVPVFNGFAHIEQCIRSLLAQTVSELEVIVVDDASSDETGPLLDRMSKSADNLHVLHLANNAGAHMARQRGLEVAQGDLIGFADADDWVDPLMYERLRAELVHHDADLAICNANNVTNDGAHMGLRGRLKQSGLIDRTIFERFCALQLGSGVLWNKLYRRDLILKAFAHPVTEVLTAGEDYLVNLHVFASARKVVLLGDALYNSRCAPASVSRSGSNARGFARTLRAYVVALESYSHLGAESIARIDELFVRQLRYPSYTLLSADELRPYHDSVRESLARLAATRPEAIYTLFHAYELFQDRPPARQELKRATRQLYRAGRELLSGRSDA